MYILALYKSADISNFSLTLNRKKYVEMKRYRFPKIAVICNRAWNASVKLIRANFLKNSTLDTKSKIKADIQLA